MPYSRSLAFERLGLPVLASAMRESHPVLKRIYSSPEIEKSLVSTLNRTFGRDLLNVEDCGGDLGMVVVIVIIAAPKAADPGEVEQQVQEM